MVVNTFGGEKDDDISSFVPVAIPPRQASQAETLLGTEPSKGHNSNMGFHLVRYSLLGEVGRFVAADAVCYPRSSRVIVRSSRGLEVGEVLAEPVPSESAEQNEGLILRKMTVEDELLVARLEKHRHSAFEACSSLLREHNVPATLMDVEHLFDGAGLFFYFLGEVPAEAEHFTHQLADLYETTVEFRKFAETLAEGCGPGCGTEQAKGQGGCDNCTSCAVAAACSTKKALL